MSPARTKNEQLNGTISRLIDMIEENNDKIINDFVLFWMKIINMPLRVEGENAAAFSGGYIWKAQDRRSGICRAYCYGRRGDFLSGRDKEICDRRISGSEWQEFWFYRGQRLYKRKAAADGNDPLCHESEQLSEIHCDNSCQGCFRWNSCHESWKMRMCWMVYPWRRIRSASM